ncbi:MAG: hypothetical protein K6E73_12475 [Bacteroidales bacterium]|nr:hypothetical protein [Bacteroidales bacterium]
MNQFVLFQLKFSDGTTVGTHFPDYLSAWSTFATALFALCALIYSWVEYRAHKKRAKAEVLRRYNERYYENNAVQYIVKYIYNNASKKRCPNPKKKFYLNLELFLRFFEEIQYSIVTDSIDKKEVRYILGYYAMRAIQCKKIKKTINDKPKAWIDFIYFVKTMNEIKNIPANENPQEIADFIKSRTDEIKEYEKRNFSLRKRIYKKWRSTRQFSQ